MQDAIDLCLHTVCIPAHTAGLMPIPKRSACIPQTTTEDKERHDDAYLLTTTDGTG